MSKLSQSFRRFAEATARCSGRPAALLVATGLVLLWAATGPYFHFDDTWQLIVNTGTSIVTFLMVFLIQNSQYRDSAALQIKLDELIRATEAHNGLLDLENLDEDALDRIRQNYRKLATRRQQQLREEADPDRQAVRATQAAQACEEMKEIDRELEKARDNALTAKSSPKDADRP